MLCILDGWGLSSRTEANAVALADTPNFDRIWGSCPHTQLSASGSDVGLPAGVFGNSEVGHLNIGAGRVVWQDSLMIDRSIEDGNFFENETLLAAMRHALEQNTNLHLMGLVSNGNVHASEGHYFTLLEMAAKIGLRADQVLFHAFTDGRDTAPRSARGFIGRLLDRMAATGVGAVASVIGRYYAMDRDNRWERVQQAYDCLVSGVGHVAADAVDAVGQAYGRSENDEFITATVVLDANGNPRPRIADNDAVIFFNYRSDRGRQLTQTFIDPEFAQFLREAWPHTHFATMTRYSSSLGCPIAFEPRPQSNGLGETVAAAGKTQLRIAETEKYPHVTYFFSGGFEVPWRGEQRILVPSPKVPTYDLQPEMSSAEVTRNVVAAIRGGAFDLIVLNYANPDMVGHTGILEAAIRAVESVDAGLGEILSAIEAMGGALLVIADHGNCEQMIDYVTREPHTAHTTNPVPCILVGKGFDNVALRSGGRLCDVSPTLLDLLHIGQPAAMTGSSLLKSGASELASASATVAADSESATLRAALQVCTDNASFYRNIAAAGAASQPPYSELGESYSALAAGLANQLPATGVAEGGPPQAHVNTALSPHEVRDASVAREESTAKAGKVLTEQASGEVALVCGRELVALAQANKMKLDAARID